MSSNPYLRVSDAVRESGMSQVQVARLLGMSPQAVRDRLRGRTRWSLAEVAAIAKHLDLDAAEILADDESDREGVPSC